MNQVLLDLEYFANQGKILRSRIIGWRTAIQWRVLYVIFGEVRLSGHRDTSARAHVGWLTAHSALPQQAQAHEEERKKGTIQFAAMEAQDSIWLEEEHFLLAEPKQGVLVSPSTVPYTPLHSYSSSIYRSSSTKPRWTLFQDSLSIHCLPLMGGCKEKGKNITKNLIFSCAFYSKWGSVPSLPAYQPISVLVRKWPHRSFGVYTEQHCSLFWRFWSLLVVVTSRWPHLPGLSLLLLLVVEGLPLLLPLAPDTQRQSVCQWSGNRYLLCIFWATTQHICWSREC